MPSRSRCGKDDSRPEGFDGCQEDRSCAQELARHSIWTQAVIHNIDPDEIENWRRHPVTQFLLQEIRKQNVNHRYRVASDLLTLGRAQGFDEALALMGRLLNSPDPIG